MWTGIVECAVSSSFAPHAAAPSSPLPGLDKGQPVVYSFLVILFVHVSLAPVSSFLPFFLSLLLFLPFFLSFSSSSHGTIVVRLALGAHRPLSSSASLLLFLFYPPLFFYSPLCLMQQLFFFFFRSEQPISRPQGHDSSTLHLFMKSLAWLRLLLSYLKAWLPPTSFWHLAADFYFQIFFSLLQTFSTLSLLGLRQGPLFERLLQNCSRATSPVDPTLHRQHPLTPRKRNDHQQRTNICATQTTSLFFGNKNARQHKLNSNTANTPHRRPKLPRQP